MDVLTIYEGLQKDLDSLKNSAAPPWVFTLINLGDIHEDLTLNFKRHFVTYTKKNWNVFMKKR